MELSPPVSTVHSINAEAESYVGIVPNRVNLRRRVSLTKILVEVIDRSPDVPETKEWRRHTYKDIANAEVPRVVITEECWGGDRGEALNKINQNSKIEILIIEKALLTIEKISYLIKGLLTPRPNIPRIMLVFDRCFIDPDQITQCMEALGTLIGLCSNRVHWTRLSRMKITSISLRPLLIAINRVKEHIRLPIVLDLSENKLGKRSSAILQNQVMHDHLRLSGLVLTRNKVVSAFSKYLKYICLRQNRTVGTEGALRIADAMKSPNNLMYLDLSACRVGTDGAEALLRASSGPTQLLQVLDLKGNAISSDVFGCLCDTQCPGHNLRRLNLSANGIRIDEDVAHTIELFIRYNKSLLDLDISSNKMRWNTQEVIKIISSAFANSHVRNRTLQRLKLTSTPREVPAGAEAVDFIYSAMSKEGSNKPNTVLTEIGTIERLRDALKNNVKELEDRKSLERVRETSPQERIAYYSEYPERLNWITSWIDGETILFFLAHYIDLDTFYRLRELAGFELINREGLMPSDICEEFKLLSNLEPPAGTATTSEFSWDSKQKIEVMRPSDFSEEATVPEHSPTTAVEYLHKYYPDLEHPNFEKFIDHIECQISAVKLAGIIDTFHYFHRKTEAHGIAPGEIGLEIIDVVGKEILNLSAEHLGDVLPVPSILLLPLHVLLGAGVKTLEKRREAQIEQQAQEEKGQAINESTLRAQSFTASDICELASMFRYYLDRDLSDIEIQRLAESCVNGKTEVSIDTLYTKFMLFSPVRVGGNEHHNGEVIHTCLGYSLENNEFVPAPSGSDDLPPIYFQREFDYESFNKMRCLLLPSLLTDFKGQSVRQCRTTQAEVTGSTYEEPEDFGVVVEVE